MNRLLSGQIRRHLTKSLAVFLAAALPMAAYAEAVENPAANSLGEQPAAGAPLVEQPVTQQNAAVTPRKPMSAQAPIRQAPNHQKLIVGLPPERIETADVLSVSPVYRTVTEVIPRESCWLETVSYERHVPARQDRSHAPVVVGGVIGGAIGHAVGHGRSNKKLGAVMGSILGASVGHNVAKQQSRGHGGYTDVTYRDEQRCKTVEETSTRQVFDGFDVTYDYQGQIYLTRMPRDPGNQLDLAVRVTPAE